MKKITLLLAVFLLSLLFVGCVNNEESKQVVLTKEAANYKVYSYQYTDSSNEYFYFITDKNGNRIDSGSYVNYYPEFTELSPKVLKKTTSFGVDASVVQYYNLSNATASKEFQGVRYDDDKIVAYVNFNKKGVYIYIQKIFEENYMICEKLNTNAATSSEIDVNVQGNTAIIKYPTSSQKNKVVKNIPLK